MSTTTTGSARFTGLAYLGLAVSGMAGYLLVRQQLYTPGDAAATAAALVGHEGLARLGTGLDLTGVLTQALAAVGFFRLFQRVSSVAAGAVAAFGLVNAVVMLVATAFSATALAHALAGGSGSALDPVGGAQLLDDVSGALWNVGGLFFGLWLIPMGWLVRRSGSMPAALGWLLTVGGVGYVLSTYLVFAAPSLSTPSYALTVPATLGELWMVGYLLVAGRGRAAAAHPAIAS